MQDHPKSEHMMRALFRCFLTSIKTSAIVTSLISLFQCLITVLVKNTFLLSYLLTPARKWERRSLCFVVVNLSIERNMGYKFKELTSF